MINKSGRRNTMGIEELRGDIADFIGMAANSPSLYDDIFDDKQVELTEDPFLPSGQIEHENNANRENGTLQSDFQLNFRNPKPESMERNPVYNSDTAGTSTRTEQLVLPLLPTSTWNVQQSFSSNAPQISQPVIRIKTEPQDDYVPSIRWWANQSDQLNGTNDDLDQQPRSSNNRGALYAREYRRKKKRHMGQLEKDNERLWRENKGLKEAYMNARQKMAGMEQEVSYLRQVLANDGTISKVLTAVIGNTAGLKYRWPMVCGNEQISGRGINTNGDGVSSDDPIERTMNAAAGHGPLGNGDGPSAIGQPAGGNPGICLHVNEDTVSVELCPRCNRDARRGSVAASKKKASFAKLSNAVLSTCLVHSSDNDDSSSNITLLPSATLSRRHFTMPPLVCSHFSSQFFRTLQQFRESRYLCDVRLIADGEIEFPAHRLVLAVSSPFFSDLFQSRKDAQDVTTVHLRNCSAECVQILLQFLYSGELQLKQCDPGKVLSVARACRIGALEQMLASYSTTVTSPAVVSPGSLQPEASPKPYPADADSPAQSATHTNKRKAKSTKVSSSAPAEQRQRNPVKTESRKMANKASFQTTQQQQQAPLLGSSGASRLDIPIVPTPSSIFMQNAPHMCPIHGIFACGCPLFAMAAASGAAAANGNNPAGDSSMAAAIQQLFFGAAAAAAAAQAAEIKERAAAGDGNNEEDTAGMHFNKVARMGNKAPNGHGMLLEPAQNGERHCQLPTTPATAQRSVHQSAQQHQAQVFVGNCSSSAPNQPEPESQASADSPQHQADRGSMSTVQVPTDDKEGWCRNKKYIKKTPQGYQCTVCKKTYGRYNSVSYHVTIYHRNPPIQCDQPGCTFSTREARYIHFHKYYRHNVALPTNIDLESRRCPFCKHVAKSPAMLEKHINRHMPESVRGQRMFRCELCKKELSSRHALVQHMMLHENEKRLACDLCSYRGRTAENLQQHKLFKHGSGDLWCAKLQCDLCQFSAPSKFQLATHQRNVHGKEDSVSTNMDKTKGYSDIEADEQCESPNENKLMIMNEDGQDGVRMHSDTEDELAMEHEEFAVEPDEQANASNEKGCGLEYRPTGSVDEEDADNPHAVEEDGQTGGSCTTGPSPTQFA